MEYRKKQRLYFIILLVNLFFVIGISIAIFFLPFFENVIWLIFILIMLYLTLSSYFFNGFLYYYQSKYQFYMLRTNASKPIPTKIEFFDKNFALLRKKEGFTEIKRYGDFFLQHRYINNKTIRFHRLGSLEVIVYLVNKKLPFDHYSIIKQINHIEDKLISKRQFIHRYYVYTIKETSSLTDEQKSEANMVQFSSIKKRHIISINLFYIRPKQHIYFLHSETFSPNAYYNYSVSQIKEWTK